MICDAYFLHNYFIGGSNEEKITYVFGTLLN